jgi:hypothetical protein
MPLWFRDTVANPEQNVSSRECEDASRDRFDHRPREHRRQLAGRHEERRPEEAAVHR